VKEMKNLVLVSAMTVGLFVLSAGSVFAAPFNAANNNPQVVAYYPDGTHGVPNEPCANHVGADLVMQLGNSGNFMQWLFGSVPCDENGALHGDHSVWKLSKNNDPCPAKAATIYQPNIGDPNYPGWGTYLVPGGTYCVTTNDFHIIK
jgi:hypothetical protein